MSVYTSISNVLSFFKDSFYSKSYIGSCTFNNC